MTEPRSMKDYEVEESSDPENQWQLLETEQELPDDLTLQETEPVQQDWRPVEYEEQQGTGGRNWILPSFIILAMIAVVGYIAWLGLNGVGFLPPSSTAAEITPTVADPSVTVMDSPATEAPTATAEPEPTPTQVPTPEPPPTPVMVEQLIGTIDSEYGLNARSGPSTDAEVIRLLESGEEFVVLQESDGWLELSLDDDTTGWVSGDFVQVTAELVESTVAVGSVTEDPGALEAPAEGTSLVDAPADEQPETAAPAEAEEPAPTETTGITPPEPFTDLIPAGPALLVLVEGGVNARTGDTTDSDIILTVPQGAALSAIGQNAAGDWLQTELPSGDKAWISEAPVETRGAVDTLPVVDPAAPEAESQATDTPLVEPTAEPAPEPATEAITSTTPVTSTESITGTTAVEPEAEDLDAQITVGLIGVKARALPALNGEVVELLGSGTTLPATGRTVDNTWVAITLANDEIAWVLVGAVDLSVEPATLPVVEP